MRIGLVADNGRQSLLCRGRWEAQGVGSARTADFVTQIIQPNSCWAAQPLYTQLTVKSFILVHFF
jgi:hypothetical protein